MWSRTDERKLRQAFQSLREEPLPAALRDRLRADVQGCVPQGARSGSRAWRYALLGLVGLVFVSFSVAVGVGYVSLGAEQFDAELQTLIRGVEFNESLINTISIDIVREWTQPNSAREWMEQNWGSDDRLPPKMVTLFSYTLQGNKCWCESRQLYPEPDITVRTDTPEQYIFDGERVCAYLPVRGLAYLHADTRARVRCRPEIALALYGRMGEPLSQWLRANTTAILGTEQVDGVPCYLVEVVDVVDQESRKTHLWIDTSRGFRPRRRQDYFADGEIRKTSELEGYSEYPGGIWLPQRVTDRSYSSTATRGERFQWYRIVYTLKEVEVNPSIPDGLFALEFPEGTHVSDASLGTTHIVAEAPPTDQDMLSIAQLATKLCVGELEWREVLEALPGQTREVPEVGVIGKGVGEPKRAYSGPNSLLIACGLLGVAATSEELAGLAEVDEEGISRFEKLLQAASAKELAVVGTTVTLSELRPMDKLAIGRLTDRCTGARFAVVVGFRDDRAVVIDPPGLLWFAPVSYLQQLWDGEAILISR